MQQFLIGLFSVFAITCAAANTVASFRKSKGSLVARVGDAALGMSVGIIFSLLVAFLIWLIFIMLMAVAAIVLP